MNFHSHLTGKTTEILRLRDWPLRCFDSNPIHIMRVGLKVDSFLFTFSSLLNIKWFFSVPLNLGKALKHFHYGIGIILSRKKEFLPNAAVSKQWNLAFYLFCVHVFRMSRGYVNHGAPVEDRGHFDRVDSFCHKGPDDQTLELGSMALVASIFTCWAMSLVTVAFFFFLEENGFNCYVPSYLNPICFSLSHQLWYRNIYKYLPCSYFRLNHWLLSKSLCSLITFYFRVGLNGLGCSHSPLPLGF